MDSRTLTLKWKFVAYRRSTVLRNYAIYNWR